MEPILHVPFWFVSMISAGCSHSCISQAPSALLVPLSYPSCSPSCQKCHFPSLPRLRMTSNATSALSLSLISNQKSPLCPPCLGLKICHTSTALLQSRLYCICCSFLFFFLIVKFKGSLYVHGKTHKCRLHLEAHSSHCLYFNCTV